MISEFQGQYRFLSNFYPCTITYEGIEYPTTEHAYQASKTLDQERRKYISQLETASQAKRAGKNVKMRSDWEEVKVDVMYDICKLKFTKPNFAQKLLVTGHQELVEGNTWNDTFWGRCKGRGQNHLGKILMKIRDELNQSI
jgi:hypothetical protein